MPTTPDRPDGRPAGSEDPFEVAEAAHLAARETVRVDREPAHKTGPGDREAARETGRGDRGAALATGRGDRETARQTDHPERTAAQGPGRGDRGAARETVKVGRDAARETVKVDLANHETRRVDVRRPHDRETVKLPGQRRPVDSSGRAPLVVAAGFATLWAALTSYLPVAAVVGLARTLEGSGGLGGAAHAGLAGWLLGHGVPLGTSIGPLALTPLLLMLLAFWRLDRAGLHVTRAIGARRSGSPRVALLVAGQIGLWYAIIGALAAVVVHGPGTDVSVVRTAVTLFVIGAAGGLIGSLRGTDTVVVLARQIPQTLRHGLRTGVVAGLLILAAGAAFAGLSIAVGGGQAADTVAAYRTGVAGQAGIILVSLAYGANGAVWAAAYLLGPGFALGADSTVRLTEVTVGPLPSLPLLAGLPAGPMGAAGAAVLAVPVLAGMAAGWLLTRRLLQSPDGKAPDWSMVLGPAVVAGPVAGVVLGVLAWISGGSLGAGRLAEIGPHPWQVALVATAVVMVSASMGAAAARTFRRA